MPFFHVTGCHSTLLPASRAGSKLVLMYRWDAGEALKLIERERINGIGGVPTMMWQLIQHPGFCDAPICRASRASATAALRQRRNWSSA